ncbi:MAG: FAD-dependent oxidoreductase [Anaerolineales bacterium]|uniref:FAD-dependent oxidoreductase n=1 Tax=Candidatus Villigracilis affinis TaxID=3140682 RepID=UPI001B6A6F67|nr:FAD-dependent oxidoreductase [Anaerolineales bacterium]MBL0345082.1 FAD-dependent oxidoreductase [Anaerolineales bacterium]MBP8047208.1 FAD-dependent oxidoreductase [Anaerolineales bacterium]
MKTQAEIVIIGGGIYGAQVAYHLAKNGRKDVVIIEKGEIASGESSHAAGLVTQFATSQAMLKFRMYSVELYSELGLFSHVGSLRVASSKEQLKEMERSVSRAKALGLDCEVISPEEAVKAMPQISKENLFGGIYLPRDGQLDPYTTTTSMAKFAKELGVEIYTNTRVTGIKVSAKGEVQAVVTDKGEIRCEIIINAAGMWAPRIAAMAGLHIPTTPVDHQHIALKAVPGHEFSPETPCLRDPDNLVYMRQEQGGLVIGGYEPKPLPRWIDGTPWEHGSKSFPGDFDQFEMLLEGAIRRLPFLDQAGIITLVRHPGAYTPDCQPLLGPMAGVKGFWMMAGMSLNGYGGAGGMGKLMAEWIIDGEAPMDVYGYRATRFGNYYSDFNYAAERTVESVKYYYRLKFPHDEHEHARPYRVSPVHYRLMENGAVFGEKFGWERVNYFDPGNEWRRMGEDQRQWGWTKPPFFERMRQEHIATRERVTLYDLTSFGKIEVKGKGALPLLQRLTSSNIDKPIGSAIYTQFLNSRGGIESDLTVTRLGEEYFWVITGSGFIANDLARIQMHVDEKDGEVSIRDITQEHGCLALWGPKSRDVLRKVTGDDISNEGHPYLMTKPIIINGVKVLAQRVSYAGELGWELYIPNNRATMVWDMLIEAGREFGMELGGYKVLDPLRLEKGFKYFTTDITPSETPYEAGLGFCVDLNKGDFIGREALMKQKAEGVKRKLCTLVLSDGDDFTQIYGGEAIYHEGKVLTRVRSGGYGFTVKKNILYAYLPTELAVKGNRFTIDLIEGRREAEVTASVLYDPKGEKLRV